MLNQLLVFLLFVLFSVNFNAQKLLRETIGSGGVSSFNSEILGQSTVGQSSLVSSEDASDYLFLSQGFNKSRFHQRKIDNWNVYVYPNPNNGNFYFYTTLKTEENIDFSVFDASGRLIKTGNGKGQEKINVDLQNVVTGIYFMHVSTKFHSITIKIDVAQ